MKKYTFNFTLKDNELEILFEAINKLKTDTLITECKVLCNDGYTDSEKENIRRWYKDHFQYIQSIEDKIFNSISSEDGEE